MFTSLVTNNKSPPPCGDLDDGARNAGNLRAAAAGAGAGAGVGVGGFQRQNDSSWMRPAQLETPLTRDQESNKNKFSLQPKDSTAPMTTRTTPWKGGNRLAWVKRQCRNNDDHPKRCFYWPALYYENWKEFSVFGSHDMNAKERLEFARRIYEEHLTNQSSGRWWWNNSRFQESPCVEDNDKDDDDVDKNEDNTPSNIVIVRLLGVEKPMEILQVDTSKDFFGDFVSWLPQVMTDYNTHGPAAFEGGHLDWYLPWTKAIDQAFALLQAQAVGHNTTKNKVSMHQTGTQRLTEYQSHCNKQKNTSETTSEKNDASAAPLFPKTPPTGEPQRGSSKGHGDSSEEGPKYCNNNRVDFATTTTTAAGCRLAQGNGTTTCHERFNGTIISPISVVAAANSHHNDKTSKTMKDTSRELLDGKSNNDFTYSPVGHSGTTTSDQKSDSNKSSSARKETNKALVTPCRSSKRPRRRAVLKTEDPAPIVLTTNRRRRMQDTDNDEDDEFYFFPNLIHLLRNELGWTYRKATSEFHIWVYERKDTKGEHRGEFLVDYFYEEEQVVNYCREHDYKEQYRHLVTGTEGHGLITPPIKRPRVTA